MSDNNIITDRSSRRKWYPLLSIAVWMWLLLAFSTTLATGYSLWFKRDLQLYGGKAPREKWQQVVARAGLSSEILDHVEQIAAETPLDRENTAEFTANDESVMKYLLAPNCQYVEGVLSKTPGSGMSINWGDAPRPFLGFVLSVLLVSGCALLFQRLCSKSFAVSFPEGVALATLELCVLTLLSGWASGHARWGFVVFALEGLVGWVVAALAVRKRRSTPPRWKKFSGFEIATVAYVVTSVAVAWLMATVTVPDDWDAWATWGAKAKVLALGHGSIEMVTHYGLPDYPLLWPSLWAFTGWCAGGWEDQVAKGWGAIFMFLVSLQVFLIVLRRTQWRTGACIAAVLVLSAPKALVVGSWGYAEPAIWLFTACMAGKLMWARSNRTDALLIGLFAAGALMTKNDGAMVVASLVCGSIAAARLWRHPVAFLMPLMAVYLPWAIWTRWMMGLSSHATEGLTLSTERLIYAFGRLPEAAGHIMRLWSDYRQWGGLLILLGFGLLVSLVMQRKSLARGWISVPLYFSGMLAVTACHNSQLGWLIGASWDRFTLQAIPLAVIVIFSLEPRAVMHLRANEDSDSDCVTDCATD